MSLTSSPGAEKARCTRPCPRGENLVVTGVGTDPDKAVQNAFSQVIEQTVGVLVDAETVVKNDELIRDEILTYSRGYVEKYEIVKRWQEAGLHHATIRAVVVRDKLVEKLRGMKIAVTEISGDLPSRQFEFDAKNEEQAGKMFRKAMAGFDMVKLTQVEIVGQPEITRRRCKCQGARQDQAVPRHGGVAAVFTVRSTDPHESRVPTRVCDFRRAATLGFARPEATARRRWNFGRPSRPLQ